MNQTPQDPGADESCPGDDRTRLRSVRTRRGTFSFGFERTIFFVCENLHLASRSTSSEAGTSATGAAVSQDAS